jgi:hypothetical protein
MCTDSLFEANIKVTEFFQKSKFLSFIVKLVLLKNKRDSHTTRMNILLSFPQRALFSLPGNLKFGAGHLVA